jgi:hypothetical protein
MSLLLLFENSGSGTTTTNYGLLLALTSEQPAPAATTTNYALLLALTSEAGAPIPPPPTTGGVGFPGRHRHRKSQTLAEFEADRPKPFGRKWFEEFKAAEKAAKEAAQAAPKRAAKKALKQVAEAAAEVRKEAELAPPYAEFDFAPLASAMEQATAARKLKDQIEAAKAVREQAQTLLAMIKRAIEDEDESLSLLLLS